MNLLRVISSNDRTDPFDGLSDGSSDIDLLHAISVALIGEQDRAALYAKIVDAAIAITRSQFGTMQLLQLAADGSHAGLELLTSRGLTPEDREVWEWVAPSAHSSCTAALKSGRRAIIADFEGWDEIAGTADLLAFRRAGIRSAQTTPLVSRDGTLLGMISTHWSEPHQPSDRDLRLLDILARQAADLLDRMRADEELRARQDELNATVAALHQTQRLQKLLSGELSHRVKNLFAMVMAVTTHTLRGSGDPLRVQALQQRLMALSSAHDILLQSSWKSALIGDVAALAVKNGGVAERVRIDGADVQLSSRAALNVALVLHELTTNALKYGSLSVGAGLVDLSWWLEPGADGDVLRLIWRESKGPAVVAPEDKGFGSKLISAGLAGSGGVVVAYNSSGLVCEISAPMAELQD